MSNVARPSSSQGNAQQSPDVRDGLTLIAIALVLLPAWLLPTSGNYILSAIQDALIPAGLLVASIALLVNPSILRARSLSTAETIFLGLLAIGIGGSMFSAAPLTRLSGMLSWLEALFIVLLLARLSNRESAQRLMRQFTVLGAVASSLFVVAQSGEHTAWPLQIYPNHMALLLILPICVATAELWSAKGKTLLWPAILGILLTLAILATKSRAVMLALALVALSAGALQIGMMIRAGRLRFLLRKLLIVAGVGLIAAILADVLLSGGIANGELRATLQTLAYPEEGSIGGRLRRWQNAIPLIEAAPWFGHGFGSWYASFDAYRHSVVPDPAGNASAVSSYVLLLGETGIIGLAIFLVFVAVALFHRSQSSLSAPRFALGAWLIALSFHSVSDFTLILAGFAFVAGLAIWRAPAPQHRSSGPISPRGAVFCVGSALALCILHSQVALAWLESYAIAKIGNGKPISEGRILWRSVDWASASLNAPFTMDSLVRSAAAPGSRLSLHPAGPDDPHLVHAQHYLSNQQPSHAIAWYRAALSRESTNPAALLGLCDAHFAADEPDRAAAYCNGVVQRNPNNHRAHRLLGEQARQRRDFEGARHHLSAAQKALWDRLGLNDFGSLSLAGVNQNYAQYRQIGGLLTSLPDTPASDASADSQHLRSLQQLPVVHTRIAVSGCTVFVTANINARHNLWEVDSCSEEPSMRILANNSLSPFQPQVADNRLYFISDRRGNGRYRLFVMDLSDGVTHQRVLPSGYLHSYRVSSVHGSLAVVMRQRDGYALYTADSNGEFALLHQSTAEMDHLHWHPTQQTLVFLAARRALWLANRAEGAASEVLPAGPFRYGNPQFSPNGRDIAVVQRTSKNAANLLVHRLEDATTRNVFASVSSYALDPVWRNDHTILFREVVHDEYLLRKLDLRDQSLKPVGPQSGVTYSIALDAETGAAWFLRSSEYRPTYLAMLPADSETFHEKLRLDWVNSNHVHPIQTDTATVADARVYRIDPVGGSSDDVVIWLHGGGSSFSPRWHTIAQQFATQGYSFVALNYAAQWSVEHGAKSTDFTKAVGQLGTLIAHLRSTGSARVHLLGVSTGTRLLHAYLADDAAPPIESAIEFAPVNDPERAQPAQNPPTAIFTGAEDPLFNAEQWQRNRDSHPGANSEITLHLFENEGHDFRGRKALSTRMLQTIEFLEEQKQN